MCAVVLAPLEAWVAQAHGLYVNPFHSVPSFEGRIPFVFHVGRPKFR